MRTILGDDPHVVEDDQPAEMLEWLAPMAGVKVDGMGTLIFAPHDNKGPDRAVFTQGPGRDRDVEVRRTDPDRVECTIIANSRGQRRMIVVIVGLEPV